MYFSDEYKTVINAYIMHLKRRSAKVALHNDKVEKLRCLFVKFERAEFLEEKAKYYNAAMSEAKLALEYNEDTQCEQVIIELMTTYLRKLLRYIISTGKKAPIDIYILLILSNSVPRLQEKLKNENPDLAEKYDEFFTLAENNKWVTNRFISQIKG
jgi:hypothetical protein